MCSICRMSSYSSRSDIATTSSESDIDISNAMLIKEMDNIYTRHPWVYLFCVQRLAFLIFLTTGLRIGGLARIRLCNTTKAVFHSALEIACDVGIPRTGLGIEVKVL